MLTLDCGVRLCRTLGQIRSLVVKRRDPYLLGWSKQLCTCKSFKQLVRFPRLMIMIELTRYPTINNLVSRLFSATSTSGELNLNEIASSMDYRRLVRLIKSLNLTLKGRLGSIGDSRIRSLV